jgi:hypothetical protein
MFREKLGATMNTEARPRLARADAIRDDEFILLTAIAALAGQLPRDLTFYGPILGAIREGYFKIKTGQVPHRGRGPKGFVQSRKPRASRRYGT